MTEAAAIPLAVQWHEGMLLSPQHFQQAERRAQALGAYLATSVSPFGWGVRRLAIDGAALVEGIFAVLELEAIMPDGLVVWSPTEPPSADLRLDLRAAQAMLHTPNDGVIAVHVTVAARGTLAPRTGELQRFRSVDGVEVADENTGDNPMPIARLQPVVGLYPTAAARQSPPGRYVSLPLAVLRAGGQGFQTIDYEPPRLRVERPTRLQTVAQDVATALRGKAKAWGELLYGAVFRGRAGATSDGLATLRAIARGLPKLEALLATGLAHPFAVYLALCDIAGDLAVAADRVMLPPPGEYLHVDPLAAFATVAGFIEQALAGLRTPHRSIAFDHPEPGRFELGLQTETAASLVIGARIAPDQDAPQVAAWFDAALIGAASRVAALRLNRVNGAAREPIASAAELNLVAPPNMLLFRVTAEPVWFAPGERLQISVPEGDRFGEPADLELFLATEAEVAVSG